MNSEVALKTSEYAIIVNADRSLIEKYYVEAFRSDTNAVNYLRAFLNSANQDTCRQELKEIYSAYIRRDGRYFGYYDYGECASYIAAIGEIREYLGERGGKQMLMSRYAAEYSRRSAFRTELQNYGWVKSRK